MKTIAPHGMDEAVAAVVYISAEHLASSREATLLFSTTRKTPTDLFEALGRVTLCLITLTNGWVEVGYSACVDAAAYDEALGRELAYKAAYKKVMDKLAFMRADALARGVDNPKADT